MTEEEYAKHKEFAGEGKPSMLRRRVGHDYRERRMYLVTMTVEGRQPLLGQLVGKAAAEPESAVACVEPSPLGRRVIEEWYAVTAHHPEVSVVAFQLMPDHLHGILFVEQEMNQHFGAIISGFKASTNKAYRQLVLGQAPPTAAAPAPPAAATPQHSEPAPIAAAASPQPAAVGCAAALPQPKAVPTAAASPQPAAVGCAAAPPQPKKRNRSHESRQHGLLWSPGYNDHILSSEDELERWIRYLADNPRRLFLRRQYPDLFRVAFGLRIGSYTCNAVGNRFLLGFPKRVQVQCSTHLYEKEIQQVIDSCMAAARSGAVLVSPSISQGEKRTMRAAFDAGLPLILITANGLGSYSKPGGEFFDTCAEGRLLILSPWKHQNRKVILTKKMCKVMNELARQIAATTPQPALTTAATPQHSE